MIRGPCVRIVYWFLFGTCLYTPSARTRQGVLFDQWVRIVGVGGCFDLLTDDSKIILYLKLRRPLVTVMISSSSGTETAAKKS